MIVMTRVGERMGASRIVGGVVAGATRVGWRKGSVGRSQVGIPVSGRVARIHIVQILRRTLETTSSLSVINGVAGVRRIVVASVVHVWHVTVVIVAVLIKL